MIAWRMNIRMQGRRWQAGRPELHVIGCLHDPQFADAPIARLSGRTGHAESSMIG
jgi:hypothetical protein